MERDFSITEIIIGCCFDVMNELGVGYLETVYKKALQMALNERGLKIYLERRYDVFFRDQKIGVYVADLVVEDKVIIELKCCGKLLPEHQAQLINYLKTSGIPTGLLVNFGSQRVEYKRLVHPSLISAQA